MKKWLFVFTASIMLVLGGCSFLDDTKKTVTYANDATDYVNEATTFGKEVPSLAKQAVGDEQAAQELETKLKEMKQKIETFDKLEAPEMAADLHQQMVDQNKKIEAGIEVYLNNIRGGKLDPSVLENTEMFQSIQEITSIIDQIKKLS
ncbi:DUF6376 family protein [Fictibacillus terranigra]|uniref:DUF6376 family protein n=1 Tax=Fictibacillus terranigra TaxID=3058424 RepID=A0ABT8E4R2_9BACL|nr:DUF6376 family protein [Fictibacillus sp. CENA-BCM004]MDN4072890.1 DUF6376 family protein [Fictibacillus sp. CENA-BCM004]